jgi:peptidoglycan glycosyltransferase
VNTHLRRTFYVFAAGFVALVGMLAYWQVYARESLANDPQNGLQTQRAISTPRGLILAGDGETVLARSVRRQAGGDPVYDRVYPQGEPFSNVVGYWSTKYGATGIEIGENSNLSGTAEPATLDGLINQMTGGPQPGNNVVLTLDPELQRVAYEGLASSVTGRGAVVAVNPNNGEILALASSPSFDPNGIDQSFPALQRDPDAPLIDRAIQSLYPPGSTFKVITAAAALEAGVSPSKTFFDDGTYELPGYTVINYKSKKYGRVSFTQALVFSINAIFAKVAVETVGAQALAQMAYDFGFDDPYEDFSLPVSASNLGVPPSEWTEGTTAQTAFGQGQVSSNAFEMALVAAAIANDGEMMEPRIVREIRSPDGIILDRPSPSVRHEPLPASTAQALNEMMQRVVTEGELTVAEVPGVEVAGKTGTAEAPPDAPHSWWITFAPAEDPEIAVCAMVENGGEGDDAALPIADSVIETYLKGGSG